MGTKLKNIATSSITKLIVWSVFIIFLFLGVRETVSLFSETIENSYSLESVYEDDYLDSFQFRDDTQQVFSYLCFTLEYENGIVEGDDNYDYYMSKGNQIYTNIPNPDVNSFTESPTNVIYQYESDGTHSMSETSILAKKGYSTNIGMSIYDEQTGEQVYGEPVYIYFAFHEEWLAEQQVIWDESAEFFAEQAYATIFISFFVAMLSALYLMIFAGRRHKQETLKLFKFDKLYSEVGLVLSLVLIAGIIGIVAFVFTVAIEASPNVSIQDNSYLVGIASILIVVSIALFIALVLSFIRKVKSRTFWKTSLTGRLFVWLWKQIKKGYDFLKKFFDGSAYDKYPRTKKLHNMQRVFIFTTLGIAFLAIFTFVFIGGGILFAAQCAITYWYIKGTQKANDDIIQEIRDSHEEQWKSENTKTELITNVSHDLKTPLTSIISYVDLLSKEEDLSESAKDYVTIIGQKSERLNHMVSDLFDLSKSASGNLSLEIETLDYKKLVEQTLADMRDNIDASGMNVKTSFPAEAVLIRTDGKKLYRVFQNVIDNALKYSLKGTRVFVSIEVQGDKAIATVKNTAGYEIDFTEEEILQRFSRGDKSRSGDGSGLGLSIAESFTQSCGGEFKLELDGDLFKVVMTFLVLE